MRCGNVDSIATKGDKYELSDDSLGSLGPGIFHRVHFSMKFYKLVIESFKLR